MKESKTGESLNKKSGLIWDLDGTLYENRDRIHQAWVTGFHQAALTHGIDITRPEAEQKMLEGHQRYGNAVRLYAIEYNIDEAVLFKTLLKFIDVGVIDPCEITGQHLHRFHSEYDMVILTSALRGWALPVLHHIGLNSIFPENRVVTYCDAGGALKSDSETPFHLAAAALSKKVNELVMVEDTPANLVIAKDLGMTTVWVTHGAKTGSRPAHVDFIVDKAYHVFDLIHQGDILWHKEHPEKSPSTAR